MRSNMYKAPTVLYFRWAPSLLADLALRVGSQVPGRSQDITANDAAEIYNWYFLAI